MPRLVEDARARLEIERESLAVAREMHQIALEHSEVLADAEDRAERLAQLGAQERPKALTFLKEAAALVPTAARSTGSGGAGSNGGDRSSSAGAGGSGGGGSITGRGITSQGGDVRAEVWLDEHCPRRPMEIPDPFKLGEFLTIEVWDCVVALGHPKAIFPVPESVAAAFPSRSSRSAGGGTQGSTGRDPRFVIPDTKTVFIGGEEPSFSGSTAQSPPSGPTADGKLVEKTLKDGFGALVKELRAGGDLGLQIRRNGGL